MLRIIAAILLILSATAHIFLVIIPHNYGRFSIINMLFAFMCVLAMVFGRRREKLAKQTQASETVKP